MVRREFGAAHLGAVFGATATGIRLAAALGPGLYGALHDASGGHRAPLLVAAGLDLAAAAVIALGRRRAVRAEV